MGSRPIHTCRACGVTAVKPYEDIDWSAVEAYHSITTKTHSRHTEWECPHCGVHRQVQCISPWHVLAKIHDHLDTRFHQENLERAETDSEWLDELTEAMGLPEV